MRYSVPRFQHLELIILRYGMLQLSVRHLTVLLSSGLLALNLWSLFSVFPLVARLACAGIPALALLPFGWARIASRPLEVWVLLLLRYWARPRLYLWQQTPASLQKNEREEVA